VPLGSLTHRRGMRHVPFGALSGNTMLKRKAGEQSRDP
jgi:hypothetical protein